MRGFFNASRNQHVLELPRIAGIDVLREQGAAPIERRPVSRSTSPRWFRREGAARMLGVLYEPSPNGWLSYTNRFPLGDAGAAAARQLV